MWLVVGQVLDTGLSGQGPLVSSSRLKSRFKCCSAVQRFNVHIASICEILQCCVTKEASHGFLRMLPEADSANRITLKGWLMGRGADGVDAMA
jgi:hypothetical protein